MFKFIKKLSSTILASTDKHPYLFMIFLVFITLRIVQTGQYFFSVIYISLTFVIICFFAISKLKKENENRIIRTTLIYLVLFLGGVYTIIALLNRYVPKEYLVVSPESWLSFFGSLFGGFIGVFGIWLSIKATNEHSEKMYSLQAVPILRFDLTEIQKNQKRRYRGIALKNNQLDLNLEMDLILKNISDFDAAKVSVTGLEIRTYDVFSEITSREELPFDYINDVLQNYPLVFRHDDIFINLDLNKSVSEDETIVVVLRLHYFDYLEIKQYSIESSFSVTINITGTSTMDDGEVPMINYTAYFTDMTNKQIRLNK